MDYKLCVCPVFSFPVQIPAFYYKYRSLYAKASVILSKCPGFYAKVPVWVRTRECHPVHLSWGVGILSRIKCVTRN